jgi:hypothetical protein
MNNQIIFIEKYNSALFFKICLNKNVRRFTPLRIQNAQRGSPFSLITAHKVGVLNEKRCKNLNNLFFSIL